MRILKIAALAVVLSCVLSATDKGPDAAGYKATNNAVYSFIDLVSGGGSASVLQGTDDGVALLTIPFAFQYYGHSYTLVCVSANGLMTFVSSAANCTGAQSVDFANTDLTSTATPGDAPTVMPYWTDLTFSAPGAGAVYYQTQGAAGSRAFVVEWSNAYPQNPSLSANPVTFEVVLYETSNLVLFQYQTVDLGAGNPATNGALATVGIRDAAGNANSRQIAWSFDAAVLGNSTAIQFLQSAQYLVGDVFPTTGDAVGGFGDGTINTVDLLAVLRAVSAVSGPTCGTDRFDAMDLDPPDTGNTRGGNGVLNVLDLLAELRLASGINTARTMRAPQARTCPPGASAQSRTQRAAEGSLEIGAPESAGDGTWRSAVYLHPGVDLDLTGFVFSVGGSGQLKFTAAGGAPTLSDDAVSGKLSLAWLAGFRASRGNAVLLGHVTASTSAPLHFIGVSANASGDGHDVNLVMGGNGRTTR